MNTEDKARMLAERLWTGGNLDEAPRLAEEEPTTATPPSLDDDEQDGPPFDYARAHRFVRWYDGLLRAHHAAATAIADENLGRSDTPSSAGDLVDVVFTLHRLLLAHPSATRAAFGAFVAEGERYASTVPGQALERRLLASPQVHQACRLFRSLSMGMLSDAGDAPLPSSYLDNLVRIVDRGAVEGVVGRMLDRIQGAR